MKVIRLFLTMLSLVSVVSVSAQFANAPASQGSYSTNQNTSPSQRVRTRPERNNELLSSKLFASFDIPSIKSNDENLSNYSGAGFSLGYIHAMPVSGMPLTIDFGGVFSYAKSTYEKGEYSGKCYDSDGDKYYDRSYEYESYLKYTYVTIPVSVAYHIKVSDKLSIVPFAGINVRLGTSASSELKYEGDQKWYDETESLDDNYSLDLFDKDDVGDDYVYSRFTLGYQIGFDLEFNKFFAGFNYNQDFVDINKYYKFRSSSIRVGLKF